MDFSKMFETWINVLTRPSEETFEAELQKPQASLVTAIIWIIIAAVILAIMSAISAVIAGLLGSSGSMIPMIASQLDLPPEMQAQLAVSSASGLAAAPFSFCLTLFAAPIGFLIGSVIFFALAKIFGGTGTFEQHTYSLAAFIAPLMVVSAVLSVIPILGSCLSIFIYLYQIFLTYLAMKATHRLSTGAALAVALIPLVVALLCVCAMFFALFSLMAGAAGSGSFE